MLWSYDLCSKRTTCSWCLLSVLLAPSGTPPGWLGDTSHEEDIVGMALPLESLYSTQPFFDEVGLVREAYWGAQVSFLDGLGLRVFLCIGLWVQNQAQSWAHWQLVNLVCVCAYVHACTCTCVCTYVHVHVVMHKFGSLSLSPKAPLALGVHRLGGLVQPESTQVSVECSVCDTEHNSSHHFYESHLNLISLGALSQMLNSLALFVPH